MDDVKKRRFLWGVALAWAPWIPTLIGLATALRGISNSRATGLVTVAGVFAELFVAYGIAAILISQTVAIVLLFLAFSPGHWTRSLFSVGFPLPERIDAAPRRPFPLVPLVPVASHILNHMKASFDILIWLARFRRKRQIRAMLPLLAWALLFAGRSGRFP